MKRGRKSAESLTIVTPFPNRRPAAPECLTAEQAEEWRAVVARMPADWFGREHFPLLEAYCRHACNARFIAAKIDSLDRAQFADVGVLKFYTRLLLMAERESRAMLALGRAMRLTQQSRLKAETAATRAALSGSDERRPWEA
jgi:hypothetical protein